MSGREGERLTDRHSKRPNQRRRENRQTLLEVDRQRSECGFEDNLCVCVSARARVCVCVCVYVFLSLGCRA